MTTTDKKLIVLADWLKNYKESFNPHTEGQMENAIRVGIEEALWRVGDMLQEILGATPELTEHFFQDSEKPCTTDIIHHHRKDDTEKLDDEVVTAINSDDIEYAKKAEQAYQEEIEKMKLES